MRDIHPCDDCPSIKVCEVSGLECQAFRLFVTYEVWSPKYRGVGFLPPPCLDCSQKEWSCENGCRLQITGRVDNPGRTLLPCPFIKNHVEGKICKMCGNTDVIEK